MYFELPSSPYSGNGLQINFDNGEKTLVRSKLQHEPTPNDQYHIITHHDELTNLAFDYYGDSKYWWVICDVNDIDNPLILEAGNTIIIPDLNNISYVTD